MRNLYFWSLLLFPTLGAFGDVFGENFFRKFKSCSGQVEEARAEIFNHSYGQKFFKLHDAQQILMSEILQIENDPFPMQIIGRSHDTLKKMVHTKIGFNVEFLKKELQTEIDNHLKDWHEHNSIRGENIIVTELKIQETEIPSTVNIQVQKPNGAILKFEGVFTQDNVYFHKETLKTANNDVENILHAFNIGTENLTLEDAIRLGYRKLEYLRDREIVERQLVAPRCHEKLLGQHKGIQNQNHMKQMEKNKRVPASLEK